MDYTFDPPGGFAAPNLPAQMEAFALAAEQTYPIFAFDDASERAAMLPSPREGETCWLRSKKKHYVFRNSAWEPLHPLYKISRGDTGTAQTRYLMQSGSQIITVHASDAYYTITFPVPFPTAMLYAFACDGDTSASENFHVSAQISNSLSTSTDGVTNNVPSTNTYMKVYARRMANNVAYIDPNTTITQFRVNWLAIGY